MSPRQGGGGRVIPDLPPGHQPAPDPTAPVSTPDTPPPFYGRKVWTGGGLPSSGSATPERTIAFSTTVLDTVIPFVYGERKVTGSCCGRGDWIGEVRPMAYVFAFGEQDSITDFEINGEAASGLSWISNITFRYGTGSETIPTGYTQFGEDADWKKYAYVTFKVNTFDADVPGSFDVTVVLGGQKVYDWRVDDTIVSSNLAVLAYDVQTKDYWKGLAPARLDTDQWEPFADWCDDAMGDDSARFAFNGVIYQRDPEAAMTEILGHGFANTYFGADGKLKIWSEMEPEALTDVWSVDGTTVTADASGGNATSKITPGGVGGIVYIGTAVRTVLTIPNDDTFTIDSSLTESAKKVRPTSGVYIRKENWVQTPIGHNTPPGSIPDIVIVNHTQSNDWGSYRYPAPGDIGGEDDKREEITFSGCTNASQAKRTSEMSRDLRLTQPFHWSAVADGTAAGLEPGDIFFFSDDSLTMQAARVLPPLVWLTGGGIAIDCRQYNPASVSLATEPNETPPTLDPGWTTDAPDAPTDATQTFGESGNWDLASLLPDADELTTGEGWTFGGGMTSAYSGGGDDWTTFTSGGSPSAGDYTGLTPGTDVLVTGLAKTGDDDWAIAWVADGAPTGSAAIKADGEWHRFAFIAPVHVTTNFIRVQSNGSESDELIVRRLQIVDWNHDPSLTLYERWGWTEDGSAGDTVDRYQMVDADNTAILFSEVPQGAVSLEHVQLILGVAGQATQWGSGTHIEATMLATGPNGGTVAFPTPTQAIEARVLKQALETFRANDLLDTARIGDITNGDYVEISETGHLTLVGDATVYEDFQVAPGDAGRLGFSDPDWVKVKDDGAGSVGVYALGFDSTKDEEVFFSIELPHSWEEGDGICPHVHWISPDATGGDEGVTWGLEYTWANEGVINGAGSPVVFGNTTIILAPDVDTFTADEHRVIDFAEIDGSGKLISSVVLCRLFRDVSDGDDDYASDAILVNIDIHFKRDSLGSQTERAKT